MTQNDEAWGKIFDSPPLLPEIERQGFVYVTADAIKAAGSREQRLLDKLDTKDSRPNIFKQNKLSILPVENGKYIIFRDESAKTYFPLGKILAEVPAEEYLPKKDYSEYQSLDVRNLSSESQAIDFAHLVSLLRTFTNEKELKPDHSRTTTIRKIPAGDSRQRSPGRGQGCTDRSRCGIKRAPRESISSKPNWAVLRISISASCIIPSKTGHADPQKRSFPFSLSIRTGFSLSCSLHSGRNTENCAVSGANVSR
ncbi:MAG: hypothetical protein WCH85_11095 [Methanomicrobiales archaeon]